MSNTETGFGGSTGLLDLHLKPGAVDNANRKLFGPVAGDTEKRKKELYEYVKFYIDEIERATTTDTEKSKLRAKLKKWFNDSCYYYDKEYLKATFIGEGKDLTKIFNPPLADAPADAAAADAADEVERRITGTGGSRKLKSRRKSSKSVRKNKKYNRRHTKSKKTKRVYK